MYNLSKRNVSERTQFIIIILVVIIAGMSQGLLLPLLATLMDESGASSGANGFNAMALYIGTFGAMLLIERPVRSFGYKRVILFGIVMMTVATCLFPVYDGLWFWFLLRIIVGIGDSALHYSSQLWITSSSPAERRGRNISLYGMSYGIGFSVGPLLMNLLHFGKALPFIAVSACFVAVFGLLLQLGNEYPDYGTEGVTVRQKYSAVYKIAWFALIPSFLYGYMESSLNSNFPVYAPRIGISSGWVSAILPALGLGSLILQLPLGLWSDRVGRKPVLMIAGLIGSAAFLLVPLAGDRISVVLVLFAIAGGLVGSFFSLGLAFAADLLPRTILPTANVIASVQFSMASIIGPNLGGQSIQHGSPGSMFYILGGLFLGFALLGFAFRDRQPADLTEAVPLQTP